MTTSRITRRSALALLALAGLSPATLALADQDEGQKLASKGHDLLLSGKPVEALDALKQAATLDPTNPWVFNLLGRAYYQSGQASQAAENFRAALRIDPGDGYSRMMLGILAQRPLSTSTVKVGGDGKPSRHKRVSQLEEDARKELDAFVKNGKSPGQRLVLIDPGHGGADRGVTGSSGLAEKNLTLALAGKVARAMGVEPGGPKVLLTREADFDEPLWARSALAGLFGADLFVSLHCSASLPGYKGVDVYTYSPEPSDAQAKAVAEMENGVTRFERSKPPALPPPGIHKFLATWHTRRLSTRGREIAGVLASGLAPRKPLDTVNVRSAPLMILANAKCPAILVQTGFLSNPEEEAALRNEEFLEKLAENLAQALTRSLG
jgi:N-acetylmuramoyl-L-alanine amidase